MFWFCGYCGYENDPRREVCRLCRRPRPVKKPLAPPVGADGKPVRPPIGKSF